MKNKLIREFEDFCADRFGAEVRKTSYIATLWVAGKMGAVCRHGTAQRLRRDFETWMLEHPQEFRAERKSKKVWQIIVEHYADGRLK